MTTGEKLQNLRKENNYTQEELADIIGVSRQSISKWESDIVFPETEKLITLSKLYHCSIDYLLNEDNNERNANVVVIGKEKTTNKYNKKRLPLIITTLGTYLILLLVFIPYWFGGTYVSYIPEYHDGMYTINQIGPSYEILISFYDLLRLKSDIFVNALAMKVMVIIALILISSTIAASIVYMFVDNKIFKITIRAANCSVLVTIIIILILSFAPVLSWTASPVIACSFMALQVLLQYIAKPIRVCR